MAVGRSVAVDRWPGMLDELLGRVAGRFPRVEPRRRVRGFVLGLLADLPRKNCWAIAEYAGDVNPDGMQHLLGRAVWDTDGVRDDLRDYVVEHLGDPHGGSMRLAMSKRALPRSGLSGNTPGPRVGSRTPKWQCI